ncbi:hypothetical protein [Streptomyces sp. YIM 130001]|uniref:hypothetical protein n=1 Tax=Streptomyces sp. YIM 130001 TaxID=2259644 RepID=UPI000E65383D|nr:hypothetical protein [Streptomyces sp. YIM 130001]
MWPGQQPPGGEQNPQDQSQNPYQQPGYQTPNPYQQPGYHTPNPYQQQTQPGGAPQWNTPAPLGAPEPPPGNDRKKTTVIAIVAATAVVIAAGVTGFFVLGGDDKDDKKKDEAKGGGDKSSSAPKTPKPTQTEEGNPRDGSGGEKATVPGWKTVVNPKWGTAFDVPAEWSVMSPGTSIGFEDPDSKDMKPLITMSAPAEYKGEWCTEDDDKDGEEDHTRLAAAGTKGANGAKNEDEVAVNSVPWWVFGGYTQPDKKSLTVPKLGKAKAYTTKAGIKGKYAWSRSTNSPQIGKSKCATDGKAISFGFKNAKGDFVSWHFYGAKGVKEEVKEETIMKILSTLRLAKDAPTG